MLLIRSIICAIIMNVGMALMFLCFVPAMLISRKGAHWAMHTWCAFALACLRMFCGLKTEVRGTPPTGQTLIAAKHQSWLDIIMIAHSCERPSFVMKKEILNIPVLGIVAKTIGCVAVDRGKGADAVRQMLDGVEGEEALGQLIIYPQGTRIPPGEKRPYKVGAGILYDQLQLGCQPIAVNTGVYWGKKSVIKHPGTAVIEYLEPIPPGLSKDAFMQRLEEVVEEASDRLLEEARADRSYSVRP